MNNVLVVYNDDTGLGYWVSKNYSPEDKYTFFRFNHDEKTDLMGLRYDDLVFIDCLVRDKERSESIKFLLSRLSPEKEATEVIKLSLGDTNE